MAPRAVFVSAVRMPNYFEAESRRVSRCSILEQSLQNDAFARTACESRTAYFSPVFVGLLRGLDVAHEGTNATRPNTQRWRHTMVYTPPNQKGSKVQFKSRYGNFIGGEWKEPVKGNYFENVTPVTGRTF
jgi:hypothetical protein